MRLWAFWDSMSILQYYGLMGTMLAFCKATDFLKSCKPSARLWTFGKGMNLAEQHGPWAFGTAWLFSKAKGLRSSSFTLIHLSPSTPPKCNQASAVCQPQQTILVWTKPGSWVDRELQEWENRFCKPKSILAFSVVFIVKIRYASEITASSETLAPGIHS